MSDPNSLNPLSETVIDWADRLAASIKAHADPRRPFVIAQLGQSLDGRIATRTGDSRWINGAEALDVLHLIRATVDAVVVGAGTVVADNPQLNVRRVPDRRTGPPPARVTIDPNGRLDVGAKWLANDGARRVSLVRVDTAPRVRAACSAPGVEPLPVPLTDNRFAPDDILAVLKTAGFGSVLIEGGAATVSHFLDAGMIDRLALLIGPVIIGSGQQGIDLSPIDKLAGALRPTTHPLPLAGGDVLIDCTFAN
ncbi:MAG: RibD family protein [Pseudomonadota bacterium]